MKLDTRTPVVRYWDDVNEGDAIEGFSLELTETKIVEQVSGSQDFYPAHHSRSFVEKAGHPAVIVSTGFLAAALYRCVTDWMGSEGWARRLRFEMRRPNRMGDTIRVRGKVTRKFVDDAGTPSVDLDVWIENDRDGTSVPGEATVQLPRR